MPGFKAESVGVVEKNMVLVAGGIRISVILIDRGRRLRIIISVREEKISYDA